MFDSLNKSLYYFINIDKEYNKRLNEKDFNKKQILKRKDNEFNIINECYKTYSIINYSFYFLKRLIHLVLNIFYILLYLILNVLYCCLELFLKWIN